MNTLKIGPAGRAKSSRLGNRDAPVEHVLHPCAAFVMARDEKELTPEPTETLPGLQAHVKSQSLRVAIKVRGKILFIDLGDVVSIQARGNYVSFERNESSFLLRESISEVAERLAIHGFIRIHRSVLVNKLFVEEIRPLATGEYRLRVEGGKEYTVTRRYKTNIKSFAEFWIGKGAFFSA